MKNILVTGGAGFIGSNFILEIFEKFPDKYIVNLDDLTYAGNLWNLSSIEDNSNYEFHKGNITNKDLVLNILQKYEIDTVINFAAESHVDRSITGPEIFLKSNVMGTFNLLECSKQYYNENKEFRFIHVSTDEVYGSLGKDGFFIEETPYKPNSPYSASKASSDHLVRSYFHTYKFPSIITNCSNNYGPYQFPEKLIPLFINNILKRKKLPVYGKGENVRDWLYVRDHCKAIMKVAEDGKIGESYNIGGNNELSNIELVTKLCKIVDEKAGTKDSEKLIKYVDDRLGHDLRYAIDSTKIKSELGWEPEETFESGLEKTIDWYLENVKWLEDVSNGNYKNYYYKN